jgi:hypothetical protein
MLRSVRLWEGRLRLSLSHGLFVVALFGWASVGPAQAQQQAPKLQLGGYEQTLRLMDQGQCDKAQLKIMPDGLPHNGDEVSMSDLGDCYIRAANKVSDPATAQRMQETGAGWILMAANGGLRRAEEQAVKLYLDGKIFFVDPYEAGKWYTLWQENHSQIQFGRLEFDPDLQKQMDGLITPDQWQEAKARAAAWKPALNFSGGRNGP